MGGFTNYCVISGIPPIAGQEEFLRQLFESRGQDEEFEAWYEKVKPPTPEEPEAEEGAGDAQAEDDNTSVSNVTDQDDADEPEEDSTQDEDEGGDEEDQDMDDAEEDGDDEEDDGIAEVPWADETETNENGDDEEDDDGDDPIESSDEEPEEDLGTSFPTPEILSALLFKDEDIKASSDYVLVAAYKPGEKDEPHKLLCSPEHEDIPADENDAAMVIFDVIPEEDSDGSYVNVNRPEEIYNAWLPKETGGFPMTFTSYCILKTAAPKLSTDLLYRFLFKNHNADQLTTRAPLLKVKYGAIIKCIGQDPEYPMVIGGDSPENKWIKLLCHKERSLEETLYEAWRGKGRLWTFVRPDRFPIAEAVAREALLQVDAPSASPAAEADQAPKKRTTRSTKAKQPSKFVSVPLDVMFLICEELPLKPFMHVLSINRTTRARLLPHVNRISYSAMQKTERYYFPVNAIEAEDAARQRPELDAWEEAWKTAGYTIADLRQTAPWLQYRIECSRSSSMRNRRRIWGIAQQIQDIATEQGIVE